jgi:hypothetical protein
MTNRDNIDDAGESVAFLRALSDRQAEEMERLGKENETLRRELAAIREAADSATIDDLPSTTSRWQPVLAAIYRSAPRAIVGPSLLRPAALITPEMVTPEAVRRGADVLRSLKEPKTRAAETYVSPRPTPASFDVGDVVRVIGDETVGMSHSFDIGAECEVEQLADGRGECDAERQAINVRVLSGRRFTQWVYPGDLVLVRKGPAHG